MAASLGRNIILKSNGVKIAGVREKSIAVNGEPVDISDDDSAGWRELLAEDGARMIDITVSGVTKNAVLRAAKFAGGASTILALTLDYEDGAQIAGNFKLVNYSETDPYQDAVTFEASLQSTGAVAYTAAP